MRLDQQYIARQEAVEREAKAGIGVYGYVGHQEMPEGEDFRDFLVRKGVTYQERVVQTTGTWEENAREHRYHRPGQGERYAYLLTSRPDIDVWSQAVHIFSQPVPDEQLGSTIHMIRQQEKDLDRLVYERQSEIDKEYPPYWRLINYNWQMSIIAYHLIKYGWTQQVERELKQWGAYNTKDGVGLENPLVQSLAAYGQLIMKQKDPDHYVHGLLDSAGRVGRHYRILVEETTRRMS